MKNLVRISYICPVCKAKSSIITWSEGEARIGRLEVICRGIIVYPIGSETKILRSSSS